jgi:hypothetical protein
MSRPGGSPAHHGLPKAPFRANSASCRHSSGVEPDPSFHVVGHNSEGNGGLGTLDAEGANEQPHGPFQDGKRMFDQGADVGFAGIGLGGARRHCSPVGAGSPRAAGRC